MENIEKFNKITTGFVIQTYKKNIYGEFVCTGQNFVASDEVEYEYEDADGNIEQFTENDIPSHEYQPFEMKF
jgi:mannosyltransferase OCH1-like enzyme